MTETTTSVNQELFQQIHLWITYTPTEHYNGQWSGCVGGKAIKIVSGEDDVYEAMDKLIADGLRRPCSCGCGSSYMGIGDAATMLLGLDDEQANELFYADTDKARNLVAAYASGLLPAMPRPEEILAA